MTLLDFHILGVGISFFWYTSGRWKAETKRHVFIDPILYGIEFMIGPLSIGLDTEIIKRS